MLTCQACICCKTCYRLLKYLREIIPKQQEIPMYHWKALQSCMVIRKAFIVPEIVTNKVQAYPSPMI